jgi:hypothetical protein
MLYYKPVAFDAHEDAGCAAVACPLRHGFAKEFQAAKLKLVEV